MEANEYLEDIKSRFIASNAIAAFTIVEELDLGDRGYFRARVTLSNLATANFKFYQPLG